MLRNNFEQAEGLVARLRRFDPVAGLFCCLFLLNAFVFVYWLDNSVLDQHFFRQTQTLLSAFWFFKEFDPLNYITPTLGYPWAIPFEFPIYQFLVALLAAVSPIDNLDIAGRIVSWGFHIATLYPLNRIMFRYTADKRLCQTASCLFLAAPFFIFWSRACLIESTAVFFCAMFAWRLIRLGDRPDAGNMLAAAIWGILSILMKVTTFPVFALLGYTHILIHTRGIFSNPARLIKLALPAVLSLFMAALWYTHADHVKEANIIGIETTSSALRGFNFGTLAQRLSVEHWLTLLKRIYEHTFSSPLVIPLAGSMALLFHNDRAFKQRLGAALICIALFFVPILIFFNLHYVHTYYQYSNLIFMTTALAFLVCPKNTGHTFKYFTMLSLLCAVMVSGFFSGKGDYMRNGQIMLWGEPELSAALEIKNNTPPESSILVFGNDYSSSIVYYAERKGLTYPDWMALSPEDFWEIKNTGMGGLPLSAVAVRTEYVPNAVVSEFLQNLQYKRKTTAGSFDIYYLLE